MEERLNIDGGEGAGAMAHRTTIVISDELWRDIQSMKGEGSAAGYIREAVLARIYFERGRAGDEPLDEAIARAKRRLR
jgi:hypothetical protein